MFWSASAVDADVVLEFALCMYPSAVFTKSTNVMGHICMSWLSGNITTAGDGPRLWLRKVARGWGSRQVQKRRQSRQQYSLLQAWNQCYEPKVSLGDTQTNISPVHLCLGAAATTRRATGSACSSGAPHWKPIYARSIYLSGSHRAMEFLRSPSSWITILITLQGSNVVVYPLSKNPA